MPRCTHCGKVNREGSLFCQDCGHRLEPQAAVAPKPAAAAGTTCSACGTINPAGMNFCKMCGTSLQRPVATPAALAATAAVDPMAAPVTPSSGAMKSTCAACGKQTPSGFAFCQHCGQRLQPAAAAAGAAPSARSAPLGGGAVAVGPTMAVNPTPPAGLPRSVASSLQRAAQAAAEDEALASTMAPTPAQLPVRKPVAAEPAPAPAAVAVGSLVQLNRDGSDGAVTPIVGEAFDIGRTEGSLTYGDDPYLAPRHARLLVQNGKILLRPIDAINGVYMKVHGGCDLQPGDQFLVGKELIRYEPLAPEERDPPSMVEHGVRLFGSAPREAWGRLRQLTVAGTTRDVWHLIRPELVVGREEGDVTFPDDEFMSRRHAAVKRAGPRARLEDLNSSNGTFLRVRGDRELKSGDVMRFGDQILRLEL
jgi:pSer/pThr/pTyr-binding forkhead associated (FHA) protein